MFYMALKKRESIFLTWDDSKKDKDILPEDITTADLKAITDSVIGDKVPKGKSLADAKQKFEDIDINISDDLNTIREKDVIPIDPGFFRDSRSDKSYRAPGFYDEYLKKEELPSVIACNYIYDFCKHDFDVLERESKNYGSLKTRFTHDETYIYNLESYIKDVVLFSQALRVILKRVSSKLTSGFYLKLYADTSKIAEKLNNLLRTSISEDDNPTYWTSDSTNAAVCFMFLSMLKASCEAFSELIKKIEVIRTKFNKIFKKACDLKKKFNDSHVTIKLKVGEALEKEAGYLPKDSKTVKVGKPFRKKEVVLSSVSSSQYTGSLDPEHNIKHKCFEICKDTINGLGDEEYKLLTEAGADKLSEVVPICFDSLLKAEKDGFCIDYEAKIATTVKDCTSEEIFCEYKTIFDSLKTIIQPFVDSNVDKAKFTIDKFVCKDLKKFMFAVEQLRKLKYDGKEILTWKYMSDEGKKEVINNVEVTLNDGLKDLLEGFLAAIVVVNGLLLARDKFLKETFSKTWVLDNAIVDAPTNVKSGKIEKKNRKLDDKGTDDSLTTKAKNAAKTVRNALVRDIQCNIMDAIIKLRGKLPETADRRVFPSLETYEFIAVDKDGKKIEAANHDGVANSTISEKIDIKDAKTIATDIYHLAVMSRAYGVWANLDDHDWKKYEQYMKERYIDFKDPFRA